MLLTTPFPLPLKTIFSLLFATVLLIIGACDQTGSASSGGNNGIAPNAAQTADKRKPVLLSGAYATSSAEGYALENLFDNDSTSGWRSKNGAGPDEGIMLYFAEPTTLSAVQLQNWEGGADASIGVYENGQPGPQGNIGQKIVLGGKPMQSLYLRFGASQSVNTAKRSDGEVEIEVQTFSPSGFVGSKMLQLFDASGAELRIEAPKRVAGESKASSTLSPESAYGTEHLFDARKEFAWVEGAKTDGSGEWIRFNFRDKVTITALRFLNGYQRSDEHYRANARLKTFNFGLEGGSVNTYTLKDDPTAQVVNLNEPLVGNAFVLNITGSYPGAKYKDLAISELVFFDGRHAFVLQTPNAPKSLLAQKTGTVLNELADRRIANHLKMPDVDVEQSLILRSDGTFVLYRNEKWFDGAESEQVADGNWELLSADGQSAKVKIFGKLTDLSQYEEYYRGKVTDKFTRIFQDELTISGNEIKGKKFIQAFYSR